MVPNFVLRLLLIAPVLPLPFVAGAPAAWISGHYCTIYNAEAEHVIVLFHGYLNDPSDYYPLALRFADAGFAVVIPRDCTDVDALARAASWGQTVSAAIRDWAAGRKVAIVGHSLGGSAAMAAAKFTPGLSAYIAMHPAPVISGIPWAKVNGPILFTTGTDDKGTFGGSTSPQQALNSYNNALYPKALVNVKGDTHGSSIALGENTVEGMAVMAWLGCFVKESTKDCEWLRTDMCNDARMEWCRHFGIGGALTAMKSVHV
jgi:pimeloyl-ACP methyl ester carboxylesterase